MYITVLVLYIAYCLLSRFIFGGPFLYEAKVIMSGSMTPTIGIYDMVVLDTRTQSFQPGDVITFETGGQFVTHRIVQITTSGRILTRGDANQANDPVELYAQQVTGKVKVVLPKVGYIFLLLETVSGKIMFGMLLLDLLLLDSLLQLIRIELASEKEGILYEKEKTIE